MSTSPQGFTFIELLVVIAMIGLLAAVAVPAYVDYTIRSQVSEGLLLTFNIKQAIGDYYTYHGKLPKDNQQAGISPPEKLMGNYVERIEVVDGNILVTFSNLTDPRIDGQTLSMRPLVSQKPSPLGILFWECGKDEKTTLTKPFLPSSCKTCKP